MRLHYIPLHQAFHRNWDGAMLRRAPKASGVQYGYQLLDGHWPNHRHFAKLAKMGQTQEVSLNLRVHPRLVHFCQFWVDGLYQHAIDILKDEIQIKGQQMEQLYVQKVKDQESGNSVYRALEDIRQLSLEMGILFRAITKYRAKARRLQRAKT